MTEKDYEQYYEQYFNDLHQYAKVILKDDFLAEEVVQSIFADLWEKKNLTIKNVYPYLLISVRNNAFQLVKANKRKHAVEINVQHRWNEEAKNLLSPDSTFTFDQLKAKLHLLPPKCKDIISLKVLDGLTNDEIAKYLDISNKTVENQITIGYQKLRAAMKVTAWFLGGISLLSIL